MGLPTTFCRDFPGGSDGKASAYNAGMKVKVKSLSRVRLFVTLWNIVHQALCPWNSPGKNTGVGSLSLLQEIFPTQESNWGLLHCRQILYQLSYVCEQGLFSIVVCGILIVLASLVVGHRLSTRDSVAAVQGLSSYSSQALEQGLSSCGTQA